MSMDSYEIPITLGEFLDTRADYVAEEPHDAPVRAERGDRVKAAPLPDFTADYGYDYVI